MKTTSVQVTHFGEDYATVEVTTQNGEVTELETSIAVGEAVAWLERKNREMQKEITRLLRLEA